MKILYGVAVKDLNYRMFKYRDGTLLWSCPYYYTWRSMISRCYSEKKLSSHPAYKECTVCSEWLTFSNFRKWMSQQKWENMHLDKDLLLEGNKVYSPMTCIFVTREVNNFTIKSEKTRGCCPLGVNKRTPDKNMINPHKNPYQAKIGNKYLGVFSTPLEAHKAWQLAKIERGSELICKYKNDKLTCEGLKRLLNKIQSDLSSGTITEGF